MSDTSGWTADGWDRVREAFAANFAKGSEVGASFSAYHRGQKVVDLWGGIADARTGTPWQEDTLALVYSTTKGITAMCANRLADQGQLDVEAPVTNYWPEFGQNGKQDVPVKYLLSHQVGLAWTDKPMSLDDALAWDPVIHALELQRPNWEPGSQHGYHATTYGWLVGEIILRITGKTPGTYVRDEIAGPLGVDFWIGLPEAEEHRVARLVSSAPEAPPRGVRTRQSEDGNDAGAAGEPASLIAMVDAFLGPDSMLSKSLTAPGGALVDPGIWNQRRLHAAEIPAANGITDARSVARLYAACLTDIDGFRIFGPEQLERARTQQTHGPNKVLFDLDLQFGLGFMLHFDLMGDVGGPRSFGHYGAGGSVGWADPEAELAIGYVMNRMEIGLTGDARSHNLVKACYASIG